MKWCHFVVVFVASNPSEQSQFVLNLLCASGRIIYIIISSTTTTFTCIYIFTCVYVNTFTHLHLIILT